jgi:hypothetical protein
MGRRGRRRAYCCHANSVTDWAWGQVPRIDAFLKSEAGLHLPRGNSLALQVAAFAEETDIQITWIIFMPGDGP